MAWTRHGHHISGTVLDSDDPERPRLMRCGGPKICKVCEADMVAVLGIQHNPGFQQEEIPVGESSPKADDPQRRAKKILAAYLNRNTSWFEAGKRHPFTVDDITTMWWVQALHNWRAVLAVTHLFEMRYELTHNGATKVTQLEAYRLDDIAEVPMYAPNRPPGEEGS